MSSPVKSLDVSSELSVVTSQNKQTVFEATKIPPEKKSSTSHFYNPAFQESLITEGTLNRDLTLASLAPLPPTTAVQSNALVELIDDPFDLTDRNQKTVLKHLCVRKVLDLLFETPSFKKCNALVRMQLAGGGVTQVVESDKEWLKHVLALLSKNNHSDNICPFPKRKLPDIDIHLIWNDKDDYYGRGIVDDLLNILGSILASENNEYVTDEIYKISQIVTTLNTDPKELKLILKAKEFVFNQKNGQKPSTEEFAHEIIRRNCLKKISDNPFATILAFGKIELVLTANPTYLLTPDRLAIAFDLAIQKNSINALRFFPNNSSSIESIVHRIAKIACIDLDPSEHSLMKAAIYTSFGYNVPQNGKFKKSIDKFVGTIYSPSTKSLTFNGELFFTRYAQYHFDDTPEEGICALFNLFTILQDKNFGYIFPKIVEHLNPLLKRTVENPLLDRIRFFLLSSTHPFPFLQYSLKHIPGVEWIESLKEYRLTFRKGEEILPFVIRSTANQALKHSAQLDELIIDLADADPSPIPNSKLEILIKSLTGKNRNQAYFQLLKSGNPIFAKIILQYFPQVYASLSKNLQEKLLAKFRKFFNEPSLDQPIEKFCTTSFADLNIAAQFWLVQLASTTFSNVAYEIWSEAKFTEEKKCVEFASALFPRNSECCLKVIHKNLVEVIDDSTIGLREQLYSKVILLKLSDLTPALETLVSSAMIWLLKGYKNDPEKTFRIVQVIQYLYPNLEVLWNSKVNFWTTLSIEDTLKFLHVQSITPLPFLDGVNELKSKISQLGSDQIHSILNLLLAKVSNAKLAIEEDQIASIISATIPFLDQLKKLKENDWIILLLSFLKKAFDLHKNSKKILFILPIKSLVSLLIENDLKTLGNALSIEQLSTLLAEILKDTSKLLEGINLKLFATFISYLVVELRNKPLEHDSLIQAIKLSGLKLEDSKELNEAKSIYELRHLDPKSSIDAQIKKLFDSLPKNSTDKAHEKAIVAFFDNQILFEKNFSKIAVFITCLKAFRSNYDFRSITEKLIAKLNEQIKKPIRNPKLSAANYILILDALFEHKLIELDKKYSAQVVQSVTQFLEVPKAKDNWQSLFGWFCHGDNQLRKLLLPVLISGLTKKFSQQLYEHLENELVNQNFPGDTSVEEKGQYIVKVLEGMMAVKSPYALELLVHHQKISLYVPYSNNFHVKWFLYFIEMVENPDEFGPIAHLVDYYEILTTTTDDKESFRSKITLLFARSTNSSHVDAAWEVLLRNFCPLDYKQAVIQLLKNVGTRSIINQRPAFLNTLLDFSKKYRLAHSSELSHPSKASDLRDKVALVENVTNVTARHKAYISISPVDWMTFFYDIDKSEGYIESLKWSLIAFKTKKLSLDNTVISCASDSINGLARDESFISKKNSKLLGKVLVQLGKSLSKYEKFSKEFLLPWEIYIQRTIDYYHDNFSVENAHLLLDAFEVIKSCPKCVEYLTTELPLISTFLKLCELDELTLFVSLWNNLTIHCESNLNTTISHDYLDSIIKDRKGTMTLSFPDTSSKIAKDRRAQAFIYSQTIIETTDALIKQSFPPRSKLFLYDLVFSCACLLLEEHKIGTKISLDLESYFKLFLYMVGRRDGDLLKNHFASPLIALTSKMCSLNIGFENSEVIFEAFVLSGFNDQIGALIANRCKFKADEKLKHIQTALDKLNSEKEISPASIYSGSFQLILMAKASHGNYLLDYLQFVNFLKITVEHLRSPFIQNSSESDLKDLQGTPIFLLRKTQNLSELCGRAKDPRTAIRECYMALFDGYLSLLSQKHLSLIPPINWIKEFQYTFFDSCFSEQYYGLMENYIAVLNDLIARVLAELFDASEEKKMEVMKRYTSVLHQFLHFESFTQEESHRKDIILRKWAELLALTEQKISAQSTSKQGGRVFYK